MYILQNGSNWQLHLPIWTTKDNCMESDYSESPNGYRNLMMRMMSWKHWILEFAMVYPTKPAVLQPDGFSSVLASMTPLEHTAFFVKTESNNIHGSCMCTCIIALYIYIYTLCLHVPCMYTYIVYIYIYILYVLYTMYNRSIDRSVDLSIYLSIDLSIYLSIGPTSIYYYMYCTISVYII